MFRVSIRHRIRKFFRAVKRSWDYAVFGWSNYDWDYGFLLALLRFKLSRMDSYFNSKFADNTLDHTARQSLRLAARLAKKLENDSYSFFIDRHNVKWYGTSAPSFGFQDLNDGTGCTRAVFPSESLSEEQQKREGEEHRAAWHDDDAMRERDVRWLFSIIAKYYATWWD